MQDCTSTVRPCIAVKSAHTCFRATESSQSSQKFTSVFPPHISMAHRPGSHLRLADMSTHTFVENLNYVNIKLQDGCLSADVAYLTRSLQEGPSGGSVHIHG